MIRSWAAAAVMLLPAVAHAQLAGDPPPYDLRLGLLQLYTFDSVTDRHVSFSEIRTTFDSSDLFGVAALELHVDARARRGWTTITADRLDVQRLYAQYGRERDAFYAKVGRVVIVPVAMALVDGVAVGGHLTEDWSWVAYGGARPHPFTLALDPRFLGGGGGYGYRDGSIDHAGGASVQFFEGDADRIFLSERFYVRFSPAWAVYGNAIVDLLDGIDLTQGHVGARFRPNNVYNVSASINHVHAIIPNRWWQDWIEAERARLGFVLDDTLLPIGTRRSSGRVTLNVTPTAGVTPYVSARYDHRHEDQAKGYEGRAGLKLASFELGYVDVAATWRRYFDADAQIASAQFGTQMFEGLFNIDAGGGVLRSTPADGEAVLLYDLNATAWLDAGAVSETLRGLQFMSLYQAFIDRDMIFHALFVRVAYRLRG